ncbi:MAG: hypothetical protein ABI818_10465 [Acidobacteriota bacterium]
MRVLGPVLMIGVLAAGAGLPGAGPPTSSGRLAETGRGERQAPTADAATVLAAAREALGGEKRLSAVKTFVATGRTRQVRGENLVPIEFEIAVELPDKYLRKDEIPAQESGPTALGFNGDDLLQFPDPQAPPARAGMPAPPAAQMEAMRKQRVLTVKQDFVRLTLGMFAGSFSTYPLTFSYAGQAEAPQGKADVVDVKAAPNLTLRLFVNSQTHLPIMVSWQAPAAPSRPGGRPGGPPAPGPPPGAPPAAAPAGPPAAAPGGPPAPPPASAPGAPTAGSPGAPPAGAPAIGPGGPAAAGPPKPVEYRIYFADYRDVDGLQWPFRLRRATGTDTTEETTFDRFRINPKIEPKKFEVRK